MTKLTTQPEQLDTLLIHVHLKSDRADYNEEEPRRKWRPEVEAAIPYPCAKPSEIQPHASKSGFPRRRNKPSEISSIPYLEK